MSVETMERVLTDEDLLELLEYLAKKNSPNFCFYKGAEEASEVATVLLQYANKTETYRPTKQEIIDEIGDLMLRLKLVCKDLDISTASIDERVFHKANKLLRYAQEGKYKGGT